MAEMVLSADYKTAVELDQRIKMTAKALAENLFSLCTMLYKMSSEKLYKELGYPNFAEYCENEVGIHRNQGMKYARIGESFSDKNAQSTVHFEKLGTEKLYLLAKLDEPEREEIQQNVNLEETSVRQLKAEIERLKEQSKKNERELSEENHELNCKCNSLVVEVNQLKSDKQAVESDLLSVKSDNRSLRHCLSEANKNLDEANEKIKELESRPVEVAVVEDKDAQAQIKLLSRELSEADQNHVNEVQKIRREYQNQINELSRQLTEMTEQAENQSVIETVDNTAVFDAYYKMIDKIIYSMEIHIASDIDVGNKMIYNHQINELIRRLEKCLKK